MATKKPKSFISMDLDFMNKKLQQYIDYLDSIDPVTVEDRYGPKEMPNGKVVRGLIKSKEDQHTANLKMMESIAKMLPAIDEMREKEAEKMEVFGKTELTGQAKKWADSNKQ